MLLTQRHKKGINIISLISLIMKQLKIKDKYGMADAILSANVICHILDLNEVADCVKSLLKPNGVFIFEDPYLGDILEKTSYDQIYDEHVYLFCANSVRNIFERYGLELFDIEPQQTHGGSMRYFAGYKAIRPISDRLKSQLENEKNLGVTDIDKLREFSLNVEASKPSEVYHTR